MKKGYTLVELLVVIVIIGVLTSIAFVGFGKIQADARDKERASNATIIAEALEKYYDKNGEYPSVPAVTNTNVSQVKSLLGIADTDVFVMPKAASGVNSITKDAVGIDKIAYNGASINQSEVNLCQNGLPSNALEGGCDKFSLQWTNENGEPGRIDSRNSTRDDNAVLSIPKDPIMAVTLSGGNMVGTVTFNMADGNPVCKTGTVSYKIKTSTAPIENIDWSTMNSTVGSWQSSNTLSTPLANNTGYYFYAIARCSLPNNTEAINPYVAKDDYFYSKNTMKASWSGTNAVGAITSTDGSTICGANLTPEYSIQYKIDTITAAGSWLPTADTWSSSSSKSVASGTTTTSPTKVSFRGKVRCNTTTTPITQGTASPYSNEDFLIGAPTAPTLARPSTYPSAQWTWPAVKCPVNTTTVYTGSHGGNFTPKPNIGTVASGYTLTGVYQNGFTYEFGVVASCGSMTSKVLGSTRASDTIAGSYADIHVGAGKFFIYEYSGSANRIRGAVVLSSDSAGYCPTGTNRYVTGQFQHNNGGAGTDSNAGWNTNYPTSYWPGGNLMMMSGQILKAVNSGLSGNDIIEFRAEVYCHNPTLNTRSNPEGRYIDRYGSLVINGINDGGTVKPLRYQILCNGQSINGSGSLPTSWLYCEAPVGQYGPIRQRNEDSAWSTF